MVTRNNMGPKNERSTRQHAPLKMTLKKVSNEKWVVGRTPQQHNNPEYATSTVRMAAHSSRPGVGERSFDGFHPYAVQQHRKDNLNGACRKEYVCVCGRQFPTAAELQQHISVNGVCTIWNKCYFCLRSGKCRLCGRCFKCFAELKVHLTSTHNIKENIEED